MKVKVHLLNGEEGTLEKIFDVVDASGVYVDDNRLSIIDAKNYQTIFNWRHVFSVSFQRYPDDTVESPGSITPSWYN